MSEFPEQLGLSPAARLSAIVESSEDAIISKDLNGIIQTWNGAAERVYGYTAEEAVGRPISILLPADRQKEEAEILQRLRRGERVKHFETTRITKKGDLIYVSLTISPILGENGKILGASHVARDITERRQFEAQIRQTQRLQSLGVLAGGIAHDFNNLLTGILGNASLIGEILPPSNPVQPLLRDVMSASQRLSDLTRQLLAYAGRGRFARQSVNLSELVREISTLIQASIPKTVQVRLQLDDSIPTIGADPSQIQQIVMNLILNGAEAIPENESGTVTVTSAVHNVDDLYIRSLLSTNELKPGTYVCLEIHDTGKGMDPETQAKIFDPFFTTKVTGRGLGLAAVLGIVSSHSGAIKVYSQAGKGSTFKVLLPADATTARKQVNTPLEDFRGTGTILVIDDEELVRNVAKASLELYGYTVCVAPDGQAGLEVYERRSDEIQLVIVDLMMPRLGGEETCRRLRHLRPDLRIVLASGYSDIEAVSKFQGKDLAGFLKKPFTAAHLAQIVKTALATTKPEPSAQAR
ncbi:MAG: PAS domain S-box protein [Acidobacteriia bacterium]|nr:PAS domain S-box protein [Terriglobia bacterium]